MAKANERKVYEKWDLRFKRFSNYYGGWILRSFQATWTC